MSIKDRLGKLTRSEKDFLNSADGKKLEDALDDFEEYLPRPRLIETIDQSFYQLSDVFRQNRIFTGRTREIKTQGDLITPDSYSSQYHVHLNPDYKYGSGRHSFNVLSSSINSNTCILVERPLPVRIGKKHTEDRYNERTSLEGALKNEDMTQIIAIATAYAKICDKSTDWGKAKEVPFAIAGENGLFLGVVVPTNEDQHFNRLYFSAVANGSKPDIDRYQWVAKSSAEIRTFIGIKDFKPAQISLYQTLRRYIDDQTCQALTHGVFNYQNTLSDRSESNPLTQEYQKAEEVLRSLSQSKIWRSGVRAPNMQYLGNGVLKPRF